METQSTQPTIEQGEHHTPPIEATKLHTQLVVVLLEDSAKSLERQPDNLLEAEDVSRPSQKASFAASDAATYFASVVEVVVHS